MVLDKKETTIGYRCPVCGTSVLSGIGMFALSADLLRLKCPCGHTDLIIEYTSNKMIRLTVPCLACPNPHTFTVSSQMFFRGEPLAFPCPYSGLDICFTGSPDNVRQSMKEADETLLELLGETEFADFTEAMHKEKLTDPQIEEIVRFVVADLDADGRISCDCPPCKGEYEVDITPEYVEITCTKCGASAAVPTDSLADATAFLGCEKIILRQP